MTMKWYRFLLIFCLCLALTACGARAGIDQDSSLVQSESSLNDASSEQDEDAPDPAWYAAHYIEGISLQRMDDFAAPDEILPDALVRFFMTANYDGVDKLPIPEGYRSADSNELLLPAEAVEEYVTEFFEIDSAYLRTGDCYRESQAAYRLEGFGITAQNQVEVTSVKETEDGLSLIFDVYLLQEDEVGNLTPTGPISTRNATFEPNGDRFKVLSLETLYLADMEQLMTPPAGDASQE